MVVVKNQKFIARVIPREITAKEEAFMSEVFALLKLKPWKKKE